jgi:thiamine-monophosphate kinase
MPDDPDESYVVDTLLSLRQAVGQSLALHCGGDDAALLRDGTTVTVDTMVEGVHWDDRLAPDDVGWKLVAVNASDLGAMGAQPEWALLALSLPTPLDRSWVAAFSRGLHAGLTHFGAVLIGGDTTRSPGPINASLTMGGRGAAIARSTAQPGDDLWVSGTLGRAAAGFFRDHPDGLAWLRRPIPPVQLGIALAADGGVTAMMDLSDGLAKDLTRLCAASGLGATVDPAALPLADGNGPRGLAEGVAFGEDYELLFTSPRDRASAIHAVARRCGATVSRIGGLHIGAGAHLSGAEWPAATFSHFGGAT